MVEAQRNYDNVHQLLDNEHKASENLSRAIKKTAMCEDYISEAQNNSGYGMSDLGVGLCVIKNTDIH